MLAQVSFPPMSFLDCQVTMFHAENHLSVRMKAPRFALYFQARTVSCVRCLCILLYTHTEVIVECDAGLYINQL